MEKHYSQIGQRPAYRLIGGEMRHGEYSWEALRRSVKEMISEDIKDLIFMGPTEHILHKDQYSEHEIIFLFSGKFVNPQVYNKQEFILENGNSLVWMPIEFIKARKEQFSPQSLCDILLSQDEFLVDKG